MTGPARSRKWREVQRRRRCQEFCVNSFRIGAVFFYMLLSSLPQALGVVEKWESWVWISTFPPPTTGFCGFFPGI